MAVYVVAVCIALIKFVSGAELNAFKARWGLYNGYYDLPWTLTEATQEHTSEDAEPRSPWHKSGYDPGLKVDLVSHFRDPRFFLLYDRQGTIAGVRFGFDKQDVSRTSLHDKQHRYTFPSKMFKSVKIWGKKIWHNTVLFTAPDTIRSTGRPNLEKGKDKVVTSLHFWADSCWQEVPEAECEVPEELTEQGCYRGVGKHYYYRTAEDSDCARWQGFFVTYHEGELSGFGISVFGSFVSTYFTTTYYEWPAFPVVKAILQHRPACVDDWLPYTGLTSVHVFLTKDAVNITCPEPDWKTSHCGDKEVVIM